MKIGIFDSGMGGISVLHQAYLTLPQESYLYYADVDHVPYGGKQNEDIVQYVESAIEFMVHHNVKAIVVACNTATSVAINGVREKYHLPILGMEPAVKAAVEGIDEKRVMVIATPVTIREEKLKNLLERVDENHRVDLLPLPQLVNFAEEEIFTPKKVLPYLTEAFSPYDLSNYSALVLGCTHFNYFKDSFRQLFGPKVELIDGSIGTVNYLKKRLSEINMLSNTLQSTKLQKYPDTEYYLSGRKVAKETELNHFYRLHERLEKMLHA